MKQRSFLALLLMFGYSQVQAIHTGNYTGELQQNNKMSSSVQVSLLMVIASRTIDRRENNSNKLTSSAYQAQKAEQEAQQRIKHQNMYPKNQQKAFVRPSDSKCDKQVRKDTPPNRQRNRNSPRTSTAKGYGAKR